MVVLATPCGTQLAAGPVARGRRASRWSPPPTTSTRSAACSTSAPRPRPAARRSWSAPRSRPGSPACWPAWPPTGSTSVDEIHVARLGTGGPACARQHHDSLGGTALDWRDGGWQRRAAGSGRELSWFPDPIGAADCYRAALPDALLLVPAFPGVGRVTARLAATRRDRLTARLPMLRPPHPEGGLGAVRVEVRGRGHEGIAVEILGRHGPSRASPAAPSPRWPPWSWARAGRCHHGASGLATMVEAKPFLRELARRGVKVASFG